MLRTLDRIVERFFKADRCLRQDTVAVILKTGIGILTEQCICFSRIFLVSDLVVKINELGKRLAHDKF